MSGSKLPFFIAFLYRTVWCIVGVLVYAWGSVPPQSTNSQTNNTVCHVFLNHLFLAPPNYTTCRDQLSD